MHSTLVELLDGELEAHVREVQTRRVARVGVAVRAGGVSRLVQRVAEHFAAHGEAAAAQDLPELSELELRQPVLSGRQRRAIACNRIEIRVDFSTLLYCTVLYRTVHVFVEAIIIMQSL